MIRLERSMMERYEIADTRPKTAEAIRFGSDRLMMTLADRMPQGVVCVTRAADVLRAQDCMYTMMIRGEDASGEAQESEHVVQNILNAMLPDDDALNTVASDPEIGMFQCHAEPDPEEIGLVAHLLQERHACGAEMPWICLFSELPETGVSENYREAVLHLAGGDADFAGWLRADRFCTVLADGMCAPVSESERARLQAKMNYRDDLLAWAEPYYELTAEKQLPDAAYPTDLDSACERKARIFDAAMLMCACGGYLSGMETVAEVMADERLRAWIGHAFHTEVLPMCGREWTAYVISAFGRLENRMNEARLLDTARGMLSRAGRSILPSIRKYAYENFESPRLLSLALAAAIMLYAGVRRNENGVYTVARGETSEPVADDPVILEAFSRLSHDMPFEALTYAALADRDIWGEDLREIDGLELRIATDISSIQRIGFRETVRLRLEEKEAEN